MNRELHLEFQVDAEEAGDRIDKLIARRAGTSRSGLRLLEVRVDGARARPKDRPPAGAHVEAVLEPEETTELKAADTDIVVVHEDPYLLVVDKPAGIPVHPAPSDLSRPSVIGTLVARYPEVGRLARPGALERPGIVHRLDRDTSGLLVVARTAEAYDALTGMVQSRELRREYAALVAGTFDVASGTVHAPIARVPGHKRFRVDPGGRAAQTRYRLQASWDRPAVTLLSVDLVTGRTHQIRVHMRSIGHPVVGDRLYGGPLLARGTRQFLHAARLELQHPVTGEDLSFGAPLPADLKGLLEDVGAPATGKIPSTWLGEFGTRARAAGARPNSVDPACGDDR